MHAFGVVAFLLVLFGMTSSDSGLIDLFAMHEEASAKPSVPAPPSAPPPGVSFDVADDDSEIDVFAAAQAKAQKRTRIIGAAVGGLALLGVLILASGSSSGQAAEPVAKAAAAPPPVAVTAIPAPAPPPPVAPAPASAEKEKPDYTRASAAAAYAGGAKKKAPIKTGSGRVPSVKLQKVHSGGTGS